MKAFTFLIFLISRVHAECTPKDLTDPDYLKSIGKENLIEHFKSPRDQDSVGWCGAYAPSDSLSFAIGVPISAIDISINYYANHPALTNAKDKKLEELRGVSPLSATDVAKKNGYCPESVIPSNQTSSSNLGNTAILNLLESFQKIYDDYAAKGKPEDYCIDCTDNYVKFLRPNLPNLTTDMIKDVLAQNYSDSLESFRELLNKLCEGQRVKINPQVKFIYKNNLGKKTVATALDEALDNNSMPSIGMNTSFFAKSESLPGGHGGHELMIVARRMGSNGKCEYLVRNSWGKSCSFYQPEIAAKCEPSKGSFWMDQDQLQSGVSDLVVIKNEKLKTPVIVTKTEDQNPISENTNNNSKTPISSKIDTFVEKATKTASKVMDSIKKTVSSLWKSLSDAFKY